MEQVIDKLIAEVTALTNLPEEDGGMSDIVPLTGVKLDDPGMVLVHEYPYAFVAPIEEVPRSETMGRGGWDVLNLRIMVVFVLNAADYFNPMVSEVPGTRELMRLSKQLRLHLRKLNKRRLDGEAGDVRDVRFVSTSYVPEVRGDAFVHLAVTTLEVEKQYQRAE